MQQFNIILILFLQDLPEKVQVEMVNDNFWTNFLLISNIIVSIIVALFIRDHIERKAKQYEVRAHIQKIKANKIIEFCIKANSTFSKICVKNPIINPINENDVKKLDKLILSEEVIFLEYSTLENIKNFRDYIIQVMEDPKYKDILKEKGFFYLIKQTLNNEAE